MRFQHWCAAALSMALVLAGGRSGSAQLPGPGGPGTSADAAFADPGAMFGPPGAPFVPPYTVAQMGVDPTGAGGVPTGANPWPAVSPFAQPAFVQHYQEDGLWFRREANERQSYFKADAMFIHYVNPYKTLVGNPLVDPNVFGEGTFQPVRVGDLFDDDDQFEMGMNLRAGYWNPDETGLYANGWWGHESKNRAWFGNPGATPSTTDLLSTGNPGLTLSDESVGGFGSNTNGAYDLTVVIDYRTEAFGADTMWLESPIVRKGAFSVRPMFGLRYMGLRESMSFLGKASGVAVGDGEEGGEEPVELADPYTAFLQSSVKTQMAGPQAGLMWDVGGERFKIISETKLAVMGAYEAVQLKGYGLGNGERSEYNPKNSFNRRDEHGHIVPLIEQTITAEAALLSYVPVVNKMPIFDRARFRIGYQYTIAWNIARPDSIDYYSPPVNPRFRYDRTTFWLSSLNLGLAWDW